MIERKFSVPLKVLERVRKKDGKEFWFTLNINYWIQVATRYHRVNLLKQKYRDLISEQVHTCPVVPDGVRIGIRFTLWVPTRRGYDLTNICCVVDKWTCDALVKAGRIRDDNCTVIAQVLYVYGGVDKTNPRCEVELIELGAKSDMAGQMELL